MTDHDADVAAVSKHYSRPCTCPHGERPLGKLHGINMGRGVVRLSTTAGCPQHASCHGFTAEVRDGQPAWSNLQCPTHRTRPCPDV